MYRLVTQLLAATLALAVLAPARADEPLSPVYLDSRAPAAPTSTPPAKKPAATTPAAVVATDHASLVEIDRQAGRLSIAASFTGTVGNLELGACAKGGRTHQSVLTLAVRPSRVVEAMAELGVRPGQVPVANAESGTVAPPTGRRVVLRVQWQAGENGGTVPRQARLEEFFWNRADSRTMADAPWIYAGSKTVQLTPDGDRLLAADVSGNVATIERSNPGAVFYYSGDLAVTAAWSANARLQTVAGTPCRLVVELVPEEKPAAAEKPADVAPAEAKPERPTPPTGQEEPAEVEPTANVQGRGGPATDGPDASTTENEPPPSPAPAAPSPEPPPDEGNVTVPSIPASPETPERSQP